MVKERFIYDELAGCPRCHCAMAAELPDGSLLATWYAGTRESHPDSAVFVSRLRPGADVWDAPRCMADTPDLSDGNSVVFCNSRGRVWLYYATIAGKGWDSARMSQRVSDDLGETFSPPQDMGLPTGFLVRNKAIVLANERVLWPVYDETDWTSLCLISDDDGETWRPSGRIERTNGIGCIQPALIERATGDIIALLRTGGQGGFVWRSDSSDGGETWSPCVATDLPNPNSGIDAVKLTGGGVLLVYNHTPDGRTPLNLAFSADECATWEPYLTLESEPGEYSYPAILQTRAGVVHILYTWRRERIKHVVLYP